MKILFRNTPMYQSIIIRIEDRLVELRYIRDYFTRNLNKRKNYYPDLTKFKTKELYISYVSDSLLINNKFRIINIKDEDLLNLVSNKISDRFIGLIKDI